MKTKNIIVGLFAALAIAGTVQAQTAAPAPAAPAAPGTATIASLTCKVGEVVLLNGQPSVVRQNDAGLYAIIPLAALEAAPVAQAAPVTMAPAQQVVATSPAPAKGVTYVTAPAQQVVTTTAAAPAAKHDGITSSSGVNNGVRTGVDAAAGFAAHDAVANKGKVNWGAVAAGGGAAGVSDGLLGGFIGRK